MECKIKNDLGTIFIAEDVMMKVVGYAALECYGIVAMSGKKATDGIVEWLGRENLSKNGIVKDKKIHRKVIDELLAEAAGHKLYCRGVSVSPIQGGDGNIEYLALFEFTEIKNAENYIFRTPDGLI